MLGVSNDSSGASLSVHYVSISHIALYCYSYTVFLALRTASWGRAGLAFIRLRKMLFICRTIEPVSRQPLLAVSHRYRLNKNLRH